ncbi:glycosyltransferase [Persicimonas caeni]|uniref:Glycosyltransferase n=1 Tax=Persicimonas caeni TaxID=2292766 RepID=A0A4Y6Q1W8_PERCE|nr:glycosyltransferase [Persicimonas caeni]QDG54566.1 glycosyltransferase [Persicimonas caeni]QED35787.1 glycosyltransferase [Persicimonas caeni]
MTQALPSVSVIIPVYDDYKRLERCLYALEGQTYPNDRYEIIVVDNGTPEERVPDIEETFSNVRAIREETPGSYAARNAGIAAATGDVFAFTDADCLPAWDWLERGVEALERDPEIGLVGGQILLFANNEDEMTLAETWEMLDGFPQEKYVEEYNFGATANVFTRREVVEDVGPFNLEFYSGGDREWGERVAADGWKVVYAAGVRVRHPARRTLGALLRKTLRTTRGDFQRQQQHGNWSPFRRATRFAEACFRLATPVPRAAWILATASGSPATRGRYALVHTLVMATKEWELIKLLCRNHPDG